MQQQATSIVELFAKRVKRSGDRVALLLPQGNEIVKRTWSEIARDVAQMISNFQKWGVSPGMHVALICENRYEWIIVDLAVQALGAVVVPLSPQLSSSKLADFIRTTKAIFACVEKAEQAAELKTELNKQPSPAGCNFFCFTGNADLICRLEPSGSSNLAKFVNDLKNNNSNEQINSILDIEFASSADQLATIVFTSGTTHEPLGVALTHQQLATNAQELCAMFENEPLAADYVGCRSTICLLAWPIAMRGLCAGSEMVLAESRERIIANAQATEPDFINGVPLFYERIHKYVQSQNWPPNEIAQRTKTLLGSKIRLLMSGGGPLPIHIEKFFCDQGLPLVQGYGLTEAGPVVATNTLLQHRLGSVGKPHAGTEIKIASSGEVLVKSNSVMNAYWQNQTASAAKLQSGWLHTGDLGTIDEAGFLSITGRANDTIVLTSGRKIQPESIETRLANEPLIAQVMVLGYGRKFPTALIVPQPDELKKLIKHKRYWVWSKRRAISHPKILETFRRRVAALLAERQPHEQIKQICLIGRAWTIETGELTHNLKLRRQSIAKNFAVEIERLYAE